MPRQLCLFWYHFGILYLIRRSVFEIAFFCGLNRYSKLCLSVIEIQDEVVLNMVLIAFSLIFDLLVSSFALKRSPKS